jgi:DNA polymerase-3 subunit delta
MTALKAHQVASYIIRPDLQAGVFLVYGPDQGLVRETAHQLMEYFGKNDDDPMAEISLDASNLQSDPGLLALEAQSVSMFGGLRRIRVREAGKGLTETLKPLFADFPESVIVIEAGNLPQRDPLRALIEKEPLGRTLPCFADNGKSLAALVRATFTEAGIGADADAVNAVIEVLGNDREITRRELEKLVLYAATSKMVTRADVLALCGDTGALVLDDIVDAAGAGQAERLDKAIWRAQDAGTDTQRILLACQRHFALLRQLRGEVDRGLSPRDALAGLRPRPHFSRLDSLEQQVRLWSDKNLSAAAARIHQTIADSRKTAQLADSHAHRALLAICISAAHR